MKNGWAWSPQEARPNHFSLSPTKLLCYKCSRRWYWIAILFCHHDPTFDSISPLSYRFFIGASVRFTTRQFWNGYNVCLIFFTPLDNHRIMLVSIAHSRLLLSCLRRLRTSFSWYGLASSPSPPANVIS